MKEGSNHGLLAIGAGAPQPEAGCSMRMKTIVKGVAIILTALCLAAIAIKVIKKNRGCSRIAMVPVTRTSLEALATALQLYCADCGEYPKVEQGLRALLRNPGMTNWAGPYIMGRDEPLDTWGSPFGYLTTYDSITLLSAGADHRFGTPDDIVRHIERRHGAYRR